MSEVGIIRPLKLWAERVLPTLARLLVVLRLPNLLKEIVRRFLVRRVVVVLRVRKVRVYLLRGPILYTVLYFIRSF